MRWPWVSRARLEEAETFWSGVAEASGRQVKTLLTHQTEMVDRYCSLVTLSNASTVAIGLVPDRTDGLMSLHIGGTHVLLSPEEARGLAGRIVDLSWNRAS